MAVGNLGGGASRLSLQTGNEPIPGLMDFLDQFEQSLGPADRARERAGRMYEARAEGAQNLMAQATEKAGEGYDFKTPDYVLGAAAVALPLLAALLPEGRGNRSRRKSDRTRDLLSGLGEMAGQGLGYRVGEFEKKRKLGLEAATEKAKQHVGTAETLYRGDLSGIQAGETGQYRRAQLGLDVEKERRLGLPKAKKEFAPHYPSAADKKWSDTLRWMDEVGMTAQEKLKYLSKQNDPYGSLMDYLGGGVQQGGGQGIPDVTSDVVNDVQNAYSGGTWKGSWPPSDADWQRLMQLNPGLDINRAKQSLGR